MSPERDGRRHSQTLILGTRGSELALTQAGTVAEQIAETGQKTRTQIISTSGDRSQAPSFGSIGPLGVFVREIEQALLDGDIDLAVHSFKDLPTLSPPGLTIAAVPKRQDPGDILLIRDGRLDTGHGWLPVAETARVGTSSARRSVWLPYFRPDLNVAPLRGNVPTRIRKLRDGEYDGIVLAAAGVARLQQGGNSLDGLLDDVTMIPLDPRRFVPAPAQGALAIQCRSDDARTLALLKQLDDPGSHAAVRLERALLARAEGGCNTAFGAYCMTDESRYEMLGMLERDGRIVSASVAGDTPERTLDQLWELIGTNS